MIKEETSPRKPISQQQSSSVAPQTTELELGCGTKQYNNQGKCVDKFTYRNACGQNEQCRTDLQLTCEQSEERQYGRLEHAKI
ncbi:unnamed protein product [Didymodactylos carnosus]|uniref:Uncharacterized protein n=1 Tax=Didymodactylos carnosus TaxID=1234261 RepID=A0A814QQX6_9BILA|nr:unnamed protein product [Didymodactylos carnosus]CAF1389068.1 unnamed protein product [Didymodactylos carnosus]CAF3887166.1 unnamed protein product [Didymodactylos carnosus]CAF4196853.1 unnamed protein product [Didymodactylos carnosus]